jgi:general secretion pathway protein A
VFEISKYIRFRLKLAGAKDVNLFDNHAVGLIGHASQGVPRVINNICDNALLYGYAAEARLITRDIVEEVVNALDLVPNNLRSNDSSGFGEASSGMK